MSVSQSTALVHPRERREAGLSLVSSIHARSPLYGQALTGATWTMLGMLMAKAAILSGGAVWICAAMIGMLVGLAIIDRADG